MNRKKSIAALGAAVLALAATGAWYAMTQRGPVPETAKSERKVLYWHDPMVPGFKSDKPGKSPFMDMQLVPVYEDETGGAAVTVRPEVASNLGVRTYTAERAALARRLRVEGYVQRVGDEALVLADVFERGSDWLRPGLTAEVRVEGLPGRAYAGRVESVQPDTGLGARSRRVVLRLDRPDPAIAANAFAEVVIQSPPAGKLLAIPREALIRTGARTAVVLALGEGRFQPVEVVPGAELGDWIEIVKGLNPGDSVVTSGQFLIDSEASVRASFARMEPTAPTQSPADGGRER